MKRSSLFICLVLILLLVMAGIPLASAASPKITGVSPSTAPNAGHFTLTITGTDLTDVTTVRLNKCKLKTGGASEAPFNGEIIGKSSTQIIATFDLTGKKIGDYDVSVNAPHDGFPKTGESAAGSFYIYSHTGSTPTATKTTGNGNNNRTHRDDVRRG